MRYSLASIVTALVACSSTVSAQTNSSSTAIGTTTPSSPSSSLSTALGTTTLSSPNSSLTTAPASPSTSTDTASVIYGNSTVIVTTITTITSCPADVTCK